MNTIHLIRNWLITQIKHRWNKNVLVTRRVSKYVNNFVLINESSEIQNAWAESLKQPLSFMQTDVSEVRFLELIIQATHAKNVLEIGTFRGFGAMHMAKALPDDGQVVTCELLPNYIEQAGKLFATTGLDKKIEIEAGPALDSLDRMINEKRVFDIIFIDADKENYLNYFKQSLKLIKSGGVIFIDNTLWAGMVTYKNSANKNTEAIKLFNEYIFSEIGDRAVIIPAWDGVTMVVAP
jgi:predicted O-methyltransferase YrrM